MRYDANAEWLEADGLGGFASGTVSAIRTRRYHALLLAATTPPTGRVVLVNGVEAWVTTSAGRFPLTSQRYEPDVIFPEGATYIDAFAPDPWPRWTFRLPDGTRIEQEIFVPRDRSACVLSWKLLGGSNAALEVRPLLSGRDYHATHHENPAFRFEAAADAGGMVTWHPYDGLPAVRAITNGNYQHAPDWYRRFDYEEERKRGLDSIEDLASPGVFRWNLDGTEAVCIFTTSGNGGLEGGTALQVARALRRRERARRRAFESPLHRAADTYLVRRGQGRTIIAGYPWFTDWGRDTFIALRGICLASGRLEEATRILVEWAGAVSDGMLPNRFPDGGDAPEFNAVDASLWYVLGVQDLLARAGAGAARVSHRDRNALLNAVDAILSSYARRTRYGIGADVDGLLACGVPGVQLTWMDARVGDRVITPRIGKPVEIQALWLNALFGASSRLPWAADTLARGMAAFQARFWNEQAGCLFDVVDCDHVAGTADPAIRPNQVFALGGLPLALVDGQKAMRALDVVESRLLTPLGLRSLDPRHSAYVPRYQGGVAERDGAYHQGTVWPWLLTAFVEAWLRARGNSPSARIDARERFVEPLLRHLDEAGLGHVSEIADADPPFTPRGCPFQAWSVGELLRLQAEVLRGRSVPLEPSVLSLREKHS
jgi:predicted glycogen debranching enzyme